MKLKEIVVDGKNLMPFVLALFSNYKRALVPGKNCEEDLLGEALLGLAQSLHRYKAKNRKKASLVTYAYLRVRGQIIRGLRRENQYHNTHEGVEVLHATHTSETHLTMEQEQLFDLVMARIETHMDPVVAAVLVWSYLENQEDADILVRLRSLDRRYKLVDVPMLRKQGISELQEHFAITKMRN